MTLTHTLSLLLLVTSAACSSAPSDEAADSADEALTGTVRGNQVHTATVDIPVDAQTLTSSYGDVKLTWSDLWKHTALVPPQALFFEVPPRDGETCDDTCIAAVIARAAKTGGTLKGTLRVERKIYGIQKAPGKCVNLLEENITLDLSAATKGIAPDLDVYDFLTLTPMMPARVELLPIPC